MKRHNSFLAGSLTLTLLLAATPFALAQAQPPAEDLKKDIEALKEGQKAIQKDLQEIKTLLQRQAPTAPAPPPQNVVLDLGKNPSKGENKAKLTLIEFSDYQ